jgi:16S rRNA (guanine527-N7)-methyltransferase
MNPVLAVDAPLDTAATQLERGLEALEFVLSDEQRVKLLQFLELLTKWNRVYNLTAIHSPQESVSAHLLDSLAIMPYLNCRRILDVGSGAGLPGIPLAIAKPECEFVLLDSSQKKTAFLRQALADLKISNARVVCERAEIWQPTRKFDCVVCRALSRLAEFVDLTKHLLASGGVFAAMKGAYPHEEIAQLSAEYRVKRVISLAIPKLNARRHLVLIESA